MKTGGNGGLWLKDANLPPPLSDHLLTPGYQPRLWLKDRALLCNAGAEKQGMYSTIPAQAEVVLDQLSTYLASWYSTMYM